MTVIEHPTVHAQRQAKQAEFADAWHRFRKCRQQADTVRDMALIGLIVVNFTDAELLAVTHLLSEHERNLIRRAGRGPC